MTWEADGKRNKTGRAQGYTGSRDKLKLIATRLE